LKFLPDEGLSTRVGSLLADAGHDAVHAHDLGLRSAAVPAGALVVIGDNRLRIRWLPIEPA
jgi:hypothetical protein